MRDGWIDAHHHLWRYKKEDYPWMTDRMDALRRDFLVDDLRLLAAKNRVDGTIAVQARQTLAETEWLLEIAERSSLIRGVVGWAPLAERDIEGQLARLSAQPKLKGMRHVLHDEPDPNYMLRPDFDAGLGLLEQFDLRYDLLIFAEHLPQTITLVDRHPHQIFIVDHLAKPKIARGEIDDWKENLRALSERPNVYCKLSGMVTEAHWSTWSETELQPYFESALSVFGASRLMFGSDWPVLTLASSYERWIAAVTRMLQSLSDAETEEIMHGTAERAYGLTVSSTPSSS